MNNTLNLFKDIQFQKLIRERLPIAVNFFDSYYLQGGTLNSAVGLDRQYFLTDIIKRHLNYDTALIRDDEFKANCKGIDCWLIKDYVSIKTTTAKGRYWLKLTWDYNLLENETPAQYLLRQELYDQMVLVINYKENCRGGLYYVSKSRLREHIIEYPHLVKESKGNSKGMKVDFTSLLMTTDYQIPIKFLNKPDSSFARKKVYDWIWEQI